MTEATTTAYRTPTGEIKYRNRERFIADCEAVEGSEFQVIFRKKKTYRNLSANAYYFAVVVQLIMEAFRDLGNDVGKVETHDYLKQQFNYTETVVGDEIIRIGKSTAGLTKAEFWQYIDRCATFAATTLNVEIPPPNSQVEIFAE